MTNPVNVPSMKTKKKPKLEGHATGTANATNNDLLALNDFFKGAINLVPASFYFTQETKEKLYSRDDSDDAAEPSEKKGVKRAAGRELLSENAQRKRRKFDPSLPHSVTELQESLVRREETESDANAAGLHKKKKRKQQLDDDDDDSSLKSSAESLDELHEKLQRKIDALRAKRNALGANDAVAKKRMKSKEKRIRLRMKHKQNKVKGQADVGDVSLSITKTSPSKPIFNKEGKMVFSKFDFSESPQEKKEPEALTGSKKYKKLLEQLEKKKQKIEQVKQTDEGKAKSMEEKMAWQSALQKAEGVKVKDNPELLKKSLKKLEKRKRQSQKAWQERSDHVQQKMQDKQEKRKKNIQSRKQAKVDKKVKRAKKKGRMIPGF